MVLKEKEWADKLEEVYMDHAKSMEAFKGICLSYNTPTWRANTDQLNKLGYK